MTGQPRILLLGYLGAQNTGAEIRLLTILDDVRAVFGPDAPITVATASRAHTLRLLTESPSLHVEQIPYVFPRAVQRLVRRHDLVLLVEGSTFKDNWSSALLYLFLWAAHAAGRAGVKTVAYAVDAGQLSRLNSALTRRVVNGMDLVVVRTAAAREQLRAIGVTLPITVTTDTAFAYHTPLSQPRRARPVTGFAPVDFHVWPVRMRLWGPAERCYHWPYYFSWNPDRAARSDQLVEAWTELISSAVREHDLDACLIAMEALDDRICERIWTALPGDVRARTTRCYASGLTPPVMVAQLRALDYLVTSRYHASVLSMETAVPQMAVYHDERLRTVYDEAGQRPHAHPQGAPALGLRMAEGFRALLQAAPQQRRALRRSLIEDFLPRCARNRDVLRQWARTAGFPTAPPLPLTADRPEVDGMVAATSSEGSG